jgi:hypothetical protein
MNRLVLSRLTPLAVGQWAAVIMLTAATILFAVPRSQAQGDDAPKILKAMSDYLASQKTISAAFDSDIEVITSDLEKIQFASSGSFLLSRPDKLRASRTGGYADVELVYDGKTLTVYDKYHKSFVQADAPGSVDQVVDRMRNEFGVEAPGADLLLSGVYDVLMKDVVDAKHIGRGVIDGVECEHLAFRNADTDWQLWVEVGPHPIPHKYVITSKAIAGSPQYTLRITDWKSDAKVAADAFAFKQPADAKKVEMGALSQLDEVPPGSMTGGNQ